MKLWPTVKLGGLCFIEDMQVAKVGKYKSSDSAICDKTLEFPENTLKGFLMTSCMIKSVRKPSNLCSVRVKRARLERSRNN